MDWMEYTVLTTTEGSELISQVLLDAGSTGTMIGRGLAIVLPTIGATGVSIGLSTTSRLRVAS